MLGVQQEIRQRSPILLPYLKSSSIFEGDHPDFSKLSDRPRDLRVAQRELMVGNRGGRVSLVQRGATSIRAQFHNVPVELPPPPSLPSHASDHCY